MRRGRIGSARGDQAGLDPWPPGGSPRFPPCRAGDSRRRDPAPGSYGYLERIHPGDDVFLTWLVAIQPIITVFGSRPSGHALPRFYLARRCASRFAAMSRPRPGFAPVSSVAWPLASTLTVILQGHRLDRVRWPYRSRGHLTAFRLRYLSVFRPGDSRVARDRNQAGQGHRPAQVARRSQLAPPGGEIAGPSASCDHRPQPRAADAVSILSGVAAGLLGCHTKP
jgi:hypothetical protein